MKTVKTYATNGRSVNVELTLPRRVFHGESMNPNAYWATYEATEEEAQKDWKFIVREYGHDCHCWQEIDGKIVWANDSDRVERHHDKLISMGF